MQLSYKSPTPYVVFEEKKFPFFQNVQLIEEYGHIPLHPWEMKGGCRPPPAPNTLAAATGIANVQEIPLLMEDDKTDREEEEEDDPPPAREEDYPPTGDEEVDDNLPELPPAGDFATRAEILQMYCLRLDGIRKTPGKPGDLWLRVSEGKVIPPYSTCHGRLVNEVIQRRYRRSGDA